MPRRGSWGRSSEVSFDRGDSFTERGHQEERRRPATGDPCKGPCNWRYREAQAKLDAYQAAVEAWEEKPEGPPPPEPEIPVVSPWLGDPILCPRCQADTRSRISLISDLAAQASAEAAGHRHGPSDDRVSGSRGPGSPSPVHDTLDQLSYELRSWQAVALGQDGTAPRTGELLPEIATLCVRLSEIYFTRLTSHPDYGADFASEMRRWHGRLKNLTTAGTSRHALPVPCHRCGNKTLEVEDGAIYVECVHRDDDGARCGLLLSRSEYEAEAQAWLARRKAPAKSPAA